MNVEGGNLNVPLHLIYLFNFCTKKAIMMDIIPLLRLMHWLMHNYLQKIKLKMENASRFHIQKMHLDLLNIQELVL